MRVKLQKVKLRIFYSEAKIVLKNMKNNKTPGTDGFPVEFYKFFWNDISSFLTRGSLAKKKIMFLHSKNKASRKRYKGEC